MTDLLRVAIELAPAFLRRSRDDLRWYLRHVLIPGLRAHFDPRSTGLASDHAIPDTGADTVNVVHYTSCRSLFCLLNTQRNWRRAVGTNAGPTSDTSSSAPIGLGSDSSDHGPLYRLYDSVHFNDPEEGAYLFRDLDSRFRWMAQHDPHRAYIASFILPECLPDDEPSTDHLPFWRSYGREATGCSISLHVPSAKLHAVRYGAQAARDTLQQLELAFAALDPLLTLVSSVDDPDIETYVRQVMATAVWESLGRVRYLYKSKAYKDETECRVIMPSAACAEDDVHHTYHAVPSPGQLRHYCEDPDLPIRKMFKSDTVITIGPAVPDRFDVRESVDRLRRQAGLYGKVVESRIKYRNNP